MRDVAYQRLGGRCSQIEHAYGDRVRLLDDPVALTRLARLGQVGTVQPAANHLIRRLYSRLFEAAFSELVPRVDVHVPTRMAATTPGAAYRGQALDRSARIVFVGVARAGTLPSYIGLELASELVEPSGVRIDHVSMERTTDEQGRVTGVSHAGSKFGGSVDGSVVLVPDPMAATGGSMVRTLELIDQLPGTPLAVATLHLIVTPEFLRRMSRARPEAHVFALRLDRGLSPPDVLAKAPGVDQRERGLDDVQYIVPGAGGLGELMTNCG